MGEDDDGDVFARVRAAAQRKMAARSQRADYFPLQLNTQGMMVRKEGVLPPALPRRLTLLSSNPQPMIFAGALYFGFLPRIVEMLGWQAVGASLAAVQSSLWGLAYYGLLVFCMEVSADAGNACYLCSPSASSRICDFSAVCPCGRHQPEGGRRVPRAGE